MLDTLRRRLLCVASCVLMLSVTLLLAVFLQSSVAVQREAEVTYLQRMSFLLSSQLEKTIDDAPQLLAAYAREMNVACLLTADDGTILYESSAIDMPVLAHDAAQSIGTTPLTDGQPASTQSGIVSITQNGQRYELAQATIVSGDGAQYSLLLAQETPSLWSLIAPALPRALLCWCAALVLIVFTTRLLLRRAFAPAEAMQRRQKEFVATAAHELKSPLAVIMANAECLSEESLSQPAKQHLALIDRECARLARLGDDLLLLTSIDAGGRQIAKQAVDVDSLLIDLYDTYQPLCARSGHPLKLDLPESPLPTIASDAAALRQILAIFLDNAQSHTPAGTHICIDTKCTANALLLRISDDGPGVSPEDAPHLFERFYRADHAHSSKKHSGLGLSIAQALANALGASVAYEPAPQGGKVNDREAGREGPLGGARFILQIPR